MNFGIRSRTGGNKAGYRLDVQVLRAIAILAVVSNHLQLKYLNLPAGYRGVDMFFVVSGFVIMSSLLKQEQDGHSFSVMKFLLRRVRRLYPSLFVVLIAVVLVSAITQSYIHVQQDTATSGLAATFFSSNYWFARKHISYFSPLYPNPLLHTWSLSVEEQFYICFGLLFFTLHKLRIRFSSRSMSLLLFGLAVVSLSSAFFSERIFDFDRTPFFFSNDQLPFYSFHTRAWELLVGILVAQILSRQKSMTNKTIQKMGGGLVLFFAVGISVTLFFGISEHKVSIFTVAIVLATGGIIAVAPNNFQSFRQTYFRKLILSVGEYSYVIYLVHWPIILLGDQIFGKSVLVKIGEICLIIFSSIALGNHVELIFSVDKIRRDSVIWRRFVLGQVVLSLAMCSLLFLAGSLERHASAYVAYEHVDDRCDSNTATCNIPISNSQYSVLLEGDSHAGAFLNSFVNVVSERQWSIKTLRPQKLEQVLTNDFSFLADGNSWIVASYFHTTSYSDDAIKMYENHLADLVENYHVEKIVVFLDNPQMENWKAPSLVSFSSGESLSRSQQIRNSHLER
ncbi:MAG: acyltransferase family protein, partial [Ilumatobacteraceae bacterium]